MTFTFWGTGTSTGVPMVGCSCSVCTSDQPRNRRHRSSLLVQSRGVNVLIDAGPDFRSQALRAGLDHLEHVLLTHAHADHILGIDDLRPVSWKHGIDVWADQGTQAQVRRVFPYAFDEAVGKSSRPRITLQTLVPGQTQRLGPLEVLPLTIRHGDDDILGFRLGPLAYLTDCNGIPEATLAALKGIDTLVLGVLRHKEHPTHFNVAQGVEAARTVGARQTWFTHLSHDLDHEALGAELPTSMAPAWDGLTLEFPDTL